MELRFTKKIYCLIFVAGLLASCSEFATTKDDSMNKNSPIDVSHTIAVAENSVVVTTTFQNVSNSPVLIMEGVWGVALRNQPMKTYTLAEPEFIVTMDGKQVRYLGPVVKRMPFTRKNFISFAPGEISRRSDQIAGDFEFLPGKHEYEIVHQHMRYDEKNDEIKGYLSRPVKFIFDKK